MERVYASIYESRSANFAEEQVFGKFKNPAVQVFGENNRANSSSQVEKEREKYQQGLGGCDEKGFFK